MYNIKGPSKIVAKTTRRGISQGIDNYRDHNNKTKISEDEDTCKLVPKPVFQKKMGPINNRHENMTPHHMELIKYVHESHRTTYVYKEEPCEILQDFKPFDLEAWWGKRLYAHITATTEE